MRRPSSALASTVLVALLAALVATRTVRAQDSSATAPPPPSAATVAPARVVRLWTPGLPDTPVLVGTVQSLDSLGVAVRTARGTWTVPWSAVRWADVRVGSRSRAAAAAFGGFNGALLGGCTALLISLAENRHVSGSERRNFVYAGAAVGAGLGVAFGAQGARDRWRRVPLPSVAGVRHGGWE